MGVWDVAVDYIRSTLYITTVFHHQSPAIPIVDPSHISAYERSGVCLLDYRVRQRGHAM